MTFIFFGTQHLLTSIIFYWHNRYQCTLQVQEQEIVYLIIQRIVFLFAIRALSSAKNMSFSSIWALGKKNTDIKLKRKFNFGQLLTKNYFIQMDRSDTDFFYIELRVNKMKRKYTTFCSVKVEKISASDKKNMDVRLNLKFNLKIEKELLFRGNTFFMRYCSKNAWMIWILLL